MERMTGQRRRRPGVRAAALLVVAGAALALSACSSGGSASPSPVPGHSIVIRNFAFVPGALKVAPGTVISVFNEDMTPHNVTSRNGNFRTGDISGGQSGKFTAPSGAGTYSYICSIHPFMRGTLVVS
jgi:plastocyanin